MVERTPILEVRFYQTAHGREPVREWLKSLPADQRKAIGEDLKTVQYGWPLGMPLVRKMAPRLWEVRSSIPSGITRILFTTVGSIMVLVHGFIKTSQATPRRELELASRRAREVQHG
jgi:phage-related protein